MKAKNLSPLSLLWFLLAFTMIFMMQCKEKGDLVWIATATTFETVTVTNRSIAFNQINLTFSHNINTTSFINAVSLKNINTGATILIIARNVSWVGTRATITRTLNPGTVYRVTIDSTILESVSGDYMKKDYKYTFRAVP